MDTFNEVMNTMMTYSLYTYVSIYIETQREREIWYWKHSSCVINRMHTYTYIYIQ